MSIQEQLRAELKDAMRQRDQRRKDVVRQIETELSLAKTAKGFSGEVDDTLYLKVRWLPTKLSDDETRALVRQAIAELEATDAKQAGRVVGHLMKQRKDELDGGMVNRIAREELSKRPD